MAEKLKILQLAPRFPFPMDDGGKIGIASIYSEYSRQNCEVTLFSFDDNKVSFSALDEAESYGKVILLPYSTKNTYKRIFMSLFSSEALFISKHYNKHLRNALIKQFSKGEFYVIHADHSSMMPLALELKKILKIPVGLRLHNIEWLIWQRYADVLPAMSPKKWYISRQAKLLRKAEATLFKDADVCFAITEQDKIRALEISPEANVVVASAGVDSAIWKPRTDIAKNPNELILATTYNWVHNVDAVRWFINSVLAKLRETNPDIILTLTGKNPPKWLNRYTNDGVNLLGYVPDVKPHLNQAAVYVAPLFVGGGIRIKILEAMAMSLPVVASSVSAEGINAGEKEGLFIADDARTFISHVQRLLGEEQLRRTAGEGARNFIINEFTWQKNVKIMIDCFSQLIRKVK